MALVFRNNKIGVEATGVRVTVPNNDRAKLMYYLNCMCVVLSLENKGYDLARLTQYQQWYNLSNDDEKVLLSLCLLLSPDKMEGKCIHLNEQACGDLQNEFYNIRAENTTFAAVESVVVGQMRVAVKKVMFYKRSWIHNYFLNPAGSLVRKIENENNRPAITYGSSSYSRAASPPRYYSRSSSDDSCCNIL